MCIMGVEYRWIPWRTEWYYSLRCSMLSPGYLWVLFSFLDLLPALSCPFGKVSVPVSRVTQHHGLNCLFILGWDVHYGKWVDTGTVEKGVGITLEVITGSPPWCLYVLISLSDLLPTLNCSFGGKKHLNPGEDSERWSNTRFRDLWYLTNDGEPL